MAKEETRNEWEVDEEDDDDEEEYWARRKG